MSLAPTANEIAARARADLRAGLPVVFSDGAKGLIALASETASTDRVEDFRALGAPFIVLSDWRARTLNLPLYEGDIARIALPKDAGSRILKALADPKDDLDRPMKGPFQSLQGPEHGSADDARTAIHFAKSAQLLPAMLCVFRDDAVAIAREHGLTVLPFSVARSQLAESQPFHAVAAARLPMVASEAGRLHVFRPDDGSAEHYAIEIGRPDRDKPVLARLHSACFTGDVLGSLKCDCGPQLHAALAQMGQDGAGILLYLNQEGRGIGLANKMRAYSLQDQGFDTVEANHRLGFEDDERDFRLGAELLQKLGFASVRLMTNNPRKVEMMRQSGIEVAERVALHVGQNAHNAHYLATKAAKSGHLL